MILFGSARSEFGNPAKGDQTGKEVSFENYYTHKQGYWLGYEPISGGEKLAQAMRELCNNNNIGYSQIYRMDAEHAFNSCGRIANISIASACDCSSAVHLCIRQAFGVNLGNFNTASEPKVLAGSGLFKPAIKVTSAEQCTLGMVLVTPNKGHTVIVVQVDQPQTPKQPKLSNEEVAKLVIAGQYGVGQERKDKLAADGYDYNTIQSIVNQILNATPTTPQVHYIAKSDYKGQSIIDALKSVGVDSSIDYRKKLATANGISLNDNVKMNTDLLKLFKAGQLKAV